VFDEKGQARRRLRPGNMVSAPRGGAQRLISQELLLLIKTGRS
jgi:hypothetical protein